jgi:tetratricopeptide (TPR) repeat protein
MQNWREELATCREIAAHAESAGDHERVIRALRRAADLLRPALLSSKVPETDDSADAPDAPDAAEKAHARGEVCDRLGALLWEEQLPEAVQAYQEAADAFGQATDEERSVASARKVVEGVRMLRHRPLERLDLLIARYDRDLRELAEMPDSDVQLAELEFKVGTVLQRRDRFSDAAERYRKSLSHFRRVEGEELGQAACHHRLGDLYNRELLDDSQALAHYRQAVALYAQHEPASEGEQMNRGLCEWHLREVRQRLSRRAPTEG